MKLGEGIRRILPDQLRQLFPRMTSSFEEFTGVVEREGAQQVLAFPHNQGKGSQVQTPIGIVGGMEFKIKFLTRTAAGKYIGYEMTCASQESGGSFHQGTKDLQLRNAITAYARLQKIKEKLPQVEIGIVFSGKRADEATIQRMLSEAERQGIEPFSAIPSEAPLVK